MPHPRLLPWLNTAAAALFVCTAHLASRPDRLDAVLGGLRVPESSASVAATQPDRAPCLGNEGLAAACGLTPPLRLAEKNLARH
jgi:hypothetical protein